MGSSNFLTAAERTELDKFAAPLKPAVQAFAREAMPPDDFEAEFLRAFQHITGTPSQPVAETLNQIFFAVDDYVGHGMTVDRSDGDLDADDLLTRVRQFAALVGWDAGN